MEYTLSADGTKLAYDVRGEGPVLVYITGATCFRTFRPVVADAKAFAAGFTVYTYDRRGRGDSGDTHPHRAEREVEGIEAIIDAAGGRAHRVGTFTFVRSAQPFRTRTGRYRMYTRYRVPRCVTPETRAAAIDGERVPFTVAVA
ncbi:alpha/beta fold hydrolase [Nocardia testacea]|uniref:alpha/beta fold hydrolase n=1 Tax=Nocardia testacea TaxID=248551 RepID=UPI003A87CC4B